MTIASLFPDTDVQLPSVFTRRDAVDLGLDPERDQILRVMHGVYTTQDADLRLRALAAVEALGDDAVICAGTALKLWGADICDRLARDDRIHVWRNSETPYVDRDGYVMHRGFFQIKPAVIDGIRLVHPVEAWLQVANDVSPDELIHMADALMRRQNPLVKYGDLVRIVRQSHRRRGIRKARMALEWACPGTDSWKETTTRLVLVRAGLPLPVVNYMVLDEFGELGCILDLAYPDAWVAVEFDGAIHVGDRAIMERDRRRHRWLEDHGWRVITITTADLRDDKAGFIYSVRQALEQAGRLL